MHAYGKQLEGLVQEASKGWYGETPYQQELGKFYAIVIPFRCPATEFLFFWGEFPTREAESSLIEKLGMADSCFLSLLDS